MQQTGAPFWDSLPPGTPHSAAQSQAAEQSWNLFANRHDIGPHRPMMYTVGHAGGVPSIGEAYQYDYHSSDYQWQRQKMHEQNAAQANTKPAKDYGGGGALRKPRRAIAKPIKKTGDQFFGLRERFKDSHLLTATNIVIFVTLGCLVCFGKFRFPKAVLGISLLLLLGCACLFFHRSRSLFWRAFCICSAMSVILGSVAGSYGYDTCGFYSSYYSHSRTYANVIASSASATLADAGRITFVKEAHLDLSRATAFAAEDGHMYCAAPIVAGKDVKSANFWAVGQDCCKIKGGFSCGAASNKKARSGAVLLDGRGHGFFSASSVERYDDARRKAQAVHGMTSGENPMYLRWMTEDDLEALPNVYDNEAAVFLAVATSVYLPVSILVARLFAKTDRKSVV